MSVKIIIVEDEAIIAAEIKSLLKRSGYEVIGKTDNGDKALDLFANLKPDLVLLDITIKGTLSGIDLAKIIRNKYNFPFIFLTSHSDLHTLNEVKETLPYGYIVKPFTQNDLRSTIELALFKFQTDNAPVFPSKEGIESKFNIALTQREYEIYAHLFKGMSYKEIAEANFISINTVKFYLKKLFEKLNVKSRGQAVAIATSKDIK